MQYKFMPFYVMLNLDFNIALISTKIDNTGQDRNLEIL